MKPGVKKYMRYAALMSGVALGFALAIEVTFGLFVGLTLSIAWGGVFFVIAADAEDK